MGRPLDGLRVVDFSRVLAAPLATQILAELGADVIKIERPGGGDETRAFEPRVGSESAYFFAFNRGKRSVILDLKTDAGRDRARSLAGGADVLVENFIPGTMDRLGLGYEDLSRSNPRLVYVAACGFDRTGPDARRKGYDTIFQALSGIMDLTGHPGGPPAKAGVPIADMTTGLWITIGALTGLVGRSISGRGAFVDITMMDVQTSLLALAAGRVFALDEDPSRAGTAHPGRVPSEAFECTDGWVQISGSDQHWAPLCEALGLDDLGADPLLRTNAGRLAHRADITEHLQKAFAGLTREEALHRLSRAGVPAGEVRTAREALDAARTGPRPMVETFRHPVVGEFPALRTPIHFHGYDRPAPAPPPVLGAHTDEVLAELDAAQDDPTSGGDDPATDDATTRSDP